MTAFLSSPTVALFVALIAILVVAAVFVTRRAVIYPAVVEVTANDVILITSDEVLSAETMAHIRRAWHEARARDGVFILPAGMRVAIISGARAMALDPQVIGG